jgi:hypothetical protein
MQRKVWAIFRVPWWALLACTLAQILFMLHGLLPARLPLISSVWLGLQALWLRTVYEESRSLYLFAIWIAAKGFVQFGAYWHFHQWLLVPLSLVNLVPFFVLLFFFGEELEKYFRQTDERGLSLSNAMIFFFGAFYFEYWLSDMASGEKEHAKAPAAPGADGWAG